MDSHRRRFSLRVSRSSAWQLATIAIASVMAGAIWGLPDHIAMAQSYPPGCSAGNTVELTTAMCTADADCLETAVDQANLFPNGCVHMSSGWYDFPAPWYRRQLLDGVDNITIFGDGQTSTRMWGEIYMLNSPNVHVRDMSVFEGWTNTGPGGAVTFSSSANGKVTNVSVNDSVWHGITFHRSTNGLVVDSGIYGSEGSGVRIQTFSGGTKVLNSTVADNGYQGVDVDASSNVEIRDNSVYMNGDTGIGVSDLTGNHGCSPYDAWCREGRGCNRRRQGMDDPASNPANVQILHNTVFDNCNVGIGADSGRNLSIVGNTVDHNGFQTRTRGCQAAGDRSGIAIQEVIGLAIRDNDVTDSYRNGVSVKLCDACYPNGSDAFLCNAGNGSVAPCQTSSANGMIDQNFVQGYSCKAYSPCNNCIVPSGVGGPVVFASTNVDGGP